MPAHSPIVQAPPITITPDMVDRFFELFLAQPPTPRAESEAGTLDPSLARELEGLGVDPPAVVAVLACGHDLRRHLEELRHAAATLSDAGIGKEHRTLLTKARVYRDAETRMRFAAEAEDMGRRLRAVRELTAAALGDLASPFIAKMRISTEVARRTASALAARLKAETGRQRLGLIAALLKWAALLDEPAKRTSAGSSSPIVRTMCWRTTGPWCKRTTVGRRACSRDPLRCHFATERVEKLLRYRRGGKTAEM